MAVRPHRRLPGLKVRPGSVRQARAEAGLSLAGVARTDLSRTAIFLIETGKSNPTLPTLELIAERTGRPIEFFLDDEPPPSSAGIDFIEIEQLLSEDRFKEVVDLCEDHLSVRLSRAETARLRFLEGIAHIRQADAERAAPLLRAAREYFEATSQKALAVECLSYETHIPFLLEDPGAQAFAQEALDRCRQLKPVPLDVELRILGRIAGNHLFNRDWTAAAEVLESVVERFDSVRDLNRMAKVYGDLGFAYRELGQSELSARYSQKAIAINDMLRDRYSASMAENTLALALVNMAQFEAAERHLDRSIELLDEIGRDRGRGNVLLSVAELELARGRSSEAGSAAHRALELATANHERATEADAHLWLGKVAAEKGDRATTDAEFAVALEQLERLGFTERLVRAHADYAEILEERGDMAAANNQLKQVVAFSRPDLISAGIREERRQQLA